ITYRCSRLAEVRKWTPLRGVTAIRPPGLIVTRSPLISVTDCGCVLADTSAGAALSVAVAAAATAGVAGPTANSDAVSAEASTREVPRGNRMMLSCLVGTGGTRAIT